jgi:succinyl-CoA synthetase beta subunit
MFALRQNRLDLFLRHVGTGSRHFSLMGENAIKVLGGRVEGTGALVIANNSEHKSTKAIKVLLHADRRPKQIPPVQSVEPIKQHFGPALIGCDANASFFKGRQYGEGELGVLDYQQERPSAVVDVPISLDHGLKLDRAFGFLLRMAPIAGLSVTEPLQWKAAEMLCRVWEAFRDLEGVWFTFELCFDGGKIKIKDPFLEFDDFAVKRVGQLVQLYEARQRDANTARAEDGGLFYIKLQKKGRIGSFGYGAGNAMATMDGLTLVGGAPANFLDGGGGANKANSRLAIETLNRDPDVKSIFVNTFGGITQTDVVAEGIIEAVKENEIEKPITVRVLGTGAERAKELLQESGLGITLHDDFRTAAKNAVERGH